MLISARRAAVLLQEEAGVARRQARRVLAAGLAGKPLVTPSAHLYDQDKVRELIGRPGLEDDRLAALFAQDAFISRRDIDVTAPRSHQLESLRGGWDISVSTLVVLKIRIREQGFAPLLAIVGGFIAAGAEITAVGLPVGRGAGVFRLRDPGPWFDDYADRQLWTGPGRDYALLTWRGTAHQPWETDPATPRSAS